MGFERNSHSLAFLTYLGRLEERLELAVDVGLEELLDGLGGELALGVEELLVLVLHHESSHIITNVSDTTSHHIIS